MSSLSSSLITAMTLSVAVQQAGMFPPFLFLLLASWMHPKDVEIGHNQGCHKTSSKCPRAPNLYLIHALYSTRMYITIMISLTRARPYSYDVHTMPARSSICQTTAEMAQANSLKFAQATTLLQPWACGDLVSVQTHRACPLRYAFSHQIFQLKLDHRLFTLLQPVLL